jgi:hypothetical protein
MSKQVVIRWELLLRPAAAAWLSGGTTVSYTGARSPQSAGRRLGPRRPASIAVVHLIKQRIRAARELSGLSYQQCGLALGYWGAPSSCSEQLLGRRAAVGFVTTEGALSSERGSPATKGPLPDLLRPPIVAGNLHRAVGRVYATSQPALLRHCQPVPVPACAWLSSAARAGRRGRLAAFTAAAGGWRWAKGQARAGIDRSHTHGHSRPAGNLSYFQEPVKLDQRIRAPNSIGILCSVGQSLHSEWTGTISKNL